MLTLETAPPVALNPIPYALTLTEDQQAAMNGVKAWLTTAKAGDIYRLYGLAGCGKTTCSVKLKEIEHPIRSAPLRVLYVAFTNRAVSILESKGCVPVRTMHSLLYDVEEYSEEEKKEARMMKQAYLEAVLAGVPPDQRPPLPPSNKRIGFGLRTAESLADQVRDFDVIAVDECSMIGQKMGRDLLKLNRPIIGIGDPGQLKPVGDVAFFSRHKPETLLTQVLRTDNDILELASWVRRGGSFSEIDSGENFTIARKAQPEWFDADITACGIHDKRRKINEHVRMLRGFEGIVPNVGERVIAVQNNKDEGILNGQLWIVTRSEPIGDYVKLDLVEYAPRKKEEDLEIRVDVRVHLGCFQKDIKDSTEMGIDVRPDSVLMTWGYAVTVHKLQGSEFNSVLLFDDGPVFRDQIDEWRYTGVTRAAKTLYVVSRH
ncbi:Dda-like helicase [Burkholderia phage Bm1]